MIGKTMMTDNKLLDKSEQKKELTDENNNIRIANERIKANERE